MGTINPAIPTVGQPNSTEDVDIRNGMITIRDEINGNLDNDNIKNAANIAGSKLAANSVAPSKLTNGTAGQLLIANSSGVVTSTTVTGDVTISDTGVTTIGSNAVGTTEIADDSITHEKMANNSVGNDEMRNDAVNTTELVDASVTTVKIADANVTAAKIKADAWTSYTPTWTALSTNPTLGNGTITGKYIQLGKTVLFRVHITFGSTTTAGSGNWSLTLPTNHNHPDYSPIGDMVAGDTGGPDFTVGTAMTTVSALGGGVNKFVCYYQTSGGVNANPIASGNPFAWGTNDIFSVTGTYEAA
jgi:hypothetical protein